MNAHPLVAVERTHLVLALAAICAGGVVGGGGTLIGVAAGAALSAANLRAIRWLSLRAVVPVEVAATAAAAAGAAGTLVTGLLLKMLLLFGLTWFALRVGGLAVLPFGAGLFVLVPALLGWGLWTGWHDRVNDRVNERVNDRMDDRRGGLI